MAIAQAEVRQDFQRKEELWYEKKEDASETRKELDIQNGNEAKGHIAECRLIEAGQFKL